MEDEKMLMVNDTSGYVVERPVTPAERLETATEVANALSGVIEQKKLYIEITDKKTRVTRRHVLSEGWQVLANLMQVGLETEWTRPVYDKDDKLYGWEARVICRAKDGQVIGSAESMCCRDERRWENANEHALRSMAQTRAVSRALRQCIGFIVKLSGFEATPAEELDAGGAVSSPTPGPRPAPPAPSRAEGQKKLSMTERGELASLAHATEQKTGVGAREVMNAVCSTLAIRPLPHGGWDIRKKDYDKVSAAVMTWEPPEAQDPETETEFSEGA